MGEVAHLRVEGGKARTHVTLSVEALGSLLALAEDIAYRRALLDAGIDRREASRLSTNHEALYGTRCDLYTSIWKRGGKGL
jgi:hypothetical protein